jgi:hypothetical protein
MVDEFDQTSNVVGDAAASSSWSGATVESEATSLTSSSTMANQTIARKEIPALYEYWKAPMVIDMDISAYHVVDWLPRVLLCSWTTLDFLTIDQLKEHCFL